MMTKQPTKTLQARSRILLVDDHPIVREGLATLIDQEQDLSVCGLAGDAAQALQLVDQLTPDLVVADLSLGGTPGLELVRDLKRIHPSLPVLVLSIHDENLWAERVLHAGAGGYIMKAQATQKVVQAIRQVLAGRTWVSDDIGSVIMHKLAGRPQTAAGSPLDALSDRELEIFQMIGQGLGVRDIAAKLYLSTKTIETHREHIRDKLRLKSSAELFRYALTHALGGK